MLGQLVPYWTVCWSGLMRMAETAISGKPCLAEIIKAHDQEKDGQCPQKFGQPVGFFGFLFLAHGGGLVIWRI